MNRNLSGSLALLLIAVLFAQNSSAGAEVQHLTAHTGEVGSMSFSPDGLTVAGGRDDGTMLLWDLKPYITPSPQTAAQSPHDEEKGEADDPSAATSTNWCTAAQTMVVSFQLRKNGKTVSICRNGPNQLVYSIGVLGHEPELEYRGPILGKFSARATLWGEGVSRLAGLAAAVTDDNTTWFDPLIDADEIANAAKSRETNGFYQVYAATGPVVQSVFIFRTGGWEYAISSTSGRPINVEADELEDYISHDITVLSPKGKMYHLR